MIFKGLLGGGNRQHDDDQGTQPDKEDDQDQARANTLRTAIIFVAAALVLVIGLWVVALFLSRPATLGEEVRRDEFLSMASSGSIQQVTLLDADNRVIGESDRGEFWVHYGQGESAVSSVLNTLEANNVPHTVDEQWAKGLFGLFSMMLPGLLIVGAIVLVILIILRTRYTQGGGLGSFGKSGVRQSTGEHKITFGDVAGQDEALEELGEVRDYLSSPERFLAMGAAVPKGILLTGPPGCGKTLLARAVAGEAGVPFFSMNGSEFVEMYVGVGAGRIRDLFKTAKAHAPCIVFIDELDAVGRGRSASAVGGQDERETTLNQLLVEMDGFESETGVVVLAATNRTDVLDPALMRPGRFDRRVGIDRPDVKGRQGILKIHARGKPFAEGVDLQRIAKRTSGFSGADLANVVNEAALLAARRGREEVLEADLAEAVERVVAGPERKSRVLTPRDRRLIAYHEAGHAIVSAALSSADVIQKVSVVGRGHAGGMTWFTREEEWLLATRSELEERLAFILAGRAAEYAAEGEPTSGAQNDLEHAIRLARRMVTEFGMGETVGAVAVDGGPRNGLAPLRSERVTSAIDTEVEGILSAAAERARSALATHRDAWESLADKLQEVETLEGPDLELMLAEVRSSRTSEVANSDGSGEG